MYLVLNFLQVFDTSPSQIRRSLIDAQANRAQRTGFCLGKRGEFIWQNMQGFFPGFPVDQILGVVG